jgi:hypothetical protein
MIPLFLLAACAPAPWYEECSLYGELGSGEGEECDDARGKLDSCELQAEETAFTDVYRACGASASAQARCEAGCVAMASCDVLAGAEEEDMGECGDEPGFRCLQACDDHDTTTPLVLSFDAAPVQFLATDGTFDLGGGVVHTDWPDARTPWLALDRDGNGRIDDGTELFGSATPLRAGGTAPNGFVALAELDADGDRRLTPADPVWPRLRAWGDADHDRVSRATELVPLARLGVTAIPLDYAVHRRCDPRGNCEGERAPLEGARPGAVIDVHLRAQQLEAGGVAAR